MNSNSRFSLLTKLCYGTVLVGMMVFGTQQVSAQSHVVIHGSVFGGGNEATVSGNTEVLMQDNATVETDVYGGGAFASTGTDGNNTTIVTIKGGTVGDADYGTDGKGNVFGGALGDATHSPLVNGAITVNIGTSDQDANNVVVKGNVFGCNNAAGTPKDSVRVFIYRMAHNATNEVGTYATFDDFKAYVATDAAHEPAAFALQAVYGGGNKADYTPNANKGARVEIFNCDNTVKMVYGGGRAAAVGVDGGTTANTRIVVNGGRIDTLFAGGDGHTTLNGGAYVANTNPYMPADIYGNVSAWVRCGYYSAVFGGSNTSGTITGTKIVQIDKSGPCFEAGDDEFIVSVFGGGNKADIAGDGEFTIACGAGYFDEVYGGANMANIDGSITLNILGGTLTNVFGGSKGVAGGAAANITGDVTLNLYGGTIVDAFGGSNQNGNIGGTITVNVLDKEATNCELHLTNLYGAGNVTAYTADDPTLASPVINVIHINNNGLGVSNDVFGGGLGRTATVTAKPVVNIGYDASTMSSILSAAPGGYSQPSGFPVAKVGNNVYGGGSLASVDGNTTVNMVEAAGDKSHTIVGGSVFGAGMGETSDYATAVVTGNTEVTISGGKVGWNVYGGGELSSVGTYTDNGATDDNLDYTACTNGKSTVTISGGQIGNIEYDKKGVKTGGYVFGGGKGLSGNNYRLHAFVDSARVNIRPGALVTASVFGGAENGHVFTNTYVEMTGGKVGQEISASQRDSEDPTTGVGRWLYFGNLYGGGRGVDAIDSIPCEVSAEYVTAAGLKVYTDGGSVTLDEADCYQNGSGKYILYGAAPAVAGVRADSLCANTYSLTAGRVRGNSTVHISSGRVVRNVYGGGSLASVGMADVAGTGVATVIVDGDAVIGLADNYNEIGANVGLTFNGKGYNAAVETWAVHDTPGEYPISTVKDSVFYRWAGRNGGNVYGSGRGEPGEGNSFYTNMAFTKNTHVTIGGNAKVRGSVFGGGENGHVRENTDVRIQDNCFIGIQPTGNDSTAYAQADSLRRGLTLTASVKHPDPNNEHWESEIGVGPTFFRGNVYGGGRGVDTVMFSIANRKHSSTAGRVYGNTNVTVTGGTIYHAVFGGGSLASVGDTVYRIKTDTSFTIAGVSGTFTSALFDAMGNILGAASASDTVVFNYADKTMVSHGADDPHNHRNFLRPQYTAAEISNGDGHQEYTIEDTNWVNYIRPYRVGDPIYGTGLATVTISGGQIGVTGINDGRVYGSGRGVAGDKTTLSEMINMAYVHNSEVYLQGNADVRGAVFGGGANGHVTQNTLVRMSGGTVGVPLPLADRKVDPATGHGRRVYRGNVYGGGRGVDPVSNADHLSNTAGRVYGNTRVNISGGKVYHSVFGGGSLASVGSYNLVNVGTNAEPDYMHYFTQGTGMAVVTISGSAWIGHDWQDLELDGKTDEEIKQALYDFVDYATDESIDIDLTKGIVDGMTAAERKSALIDSNYRYLGSNSGMVFGSGRGVAALKDGTFDRDYAEAAFTNNTIVTVKDEDGHSPMICGSVFGGGENGHVKHNTLVTIEGGIIGGIPLHSTSFVTNATSDEAGTLPIQFSQNATAITLDFLYEDAEEETGVGPTVYRGNVYGGGRGVDHMGDKAVQGFSATAGRVYGNTKVNVTGGHIYHHVFGGGSIASVGTYDTVTGSEGWDAKLTGSPKQVNKIFEYTTQAIAKDHAANPSLALGDNDTMQFVTGNIEVNISGGRIGRTGKNEGSIFGGGRGIAGERTKQVIHLAFANNTTVNILQGAYVTGSVFGGGANGHVLSDAHVNVSGGVVGTAFSVDDTLTTSYGYSPHNVFHGNVYGGGRGVDPTDASRVSRTAGRVYGNTYVTMTGGWVRHSVYGGGSLASVGNYETYPADVTVRNAANDGDSVIHRKDDIKHLRWLDVETGTLHNYDASKSFDDADNVLVESHSGRATVKILDGWVGARPASGDGSEYHYADGNNDLLRGQGGEGRNNGRVFGSCRGTAGAGYDSLAYVNITRVVIGPDPVADASYTGTGEPRIMSCVFGSGENGHVLDSTHVQMFSGQVGRGKKVTDWKQSFIGNLYGGGRGVDISLANGKPSPSAGWVHNSTCVEVFGGHVWHNVFGGGSMAAVGDTNHTGYENADITSRVGRTRVIIKGGLIGSDGDNNGNVFGSGRGRAGLQVDTIFVNRARLGSAAGSGTYNLVTDAVTNLTNAFGSGTYTASSYSNYGGEADLYCVFKNGTILTVDHDYSEMTYVVNSIVTVDYTNNSTDYASIANTDRIAGSVYGSGDNGHVHHDSYVFVKNGTIGTKPDGGYIDLTETVVDPQYPTVAAAQRDVTTRYYVVPTSGSVYGSGRGLDYTDDDELSHTAGRVYGNTYVAVSGGNILRNVYGGGNMATVGTYSPRYEGDNPANALLRLDFLAGTGTANVLVTGKPVIGLEGATTGEHANDNPAVVYGCVYGSSRGFMGPGYAELAFTNNTVVTIGDLAASTTDDWPVIYGSVFGGGENGHVRTNTTVTVNHGTIGKSLPADFASLGDNAKKHFEYIGNVYGGGRGVDNENGIYSYSAGYVRNQTSVTINGGTINRNVYGGGSMGLVGDYGFHGELETYQGATNAAIWGSDNGLATVLVKSDVGTAANRSIAPDYGGSVYGSCRGRANNPTTDNPAYNPASGGDFKYRGAMDQNGTCDEVFGEMAYVFKSHVTVDATGHTVYGSVYGGGENGHVDYGGTTVDILDGTIKGNIFGGGKGGSTSPTAGIVDGNTQVNIGAEVSSGVYSGNATIEGNVFGGNDAGSSPLGIMRVDVYATAHTAANTCPTAMAPDLPDTTGSDVATKYAIYGVYGGGNQASVLTGDGDTDCDVAIYDNLYQGRITGSWPVSTDRKSVVYVHGCDNTIMYVYGGGRAANTLNNNVTIEGGRFFQVYAGGNGSSAEVPGNPGANVSKLTGSIAPPDCGDATVTVLGGLVGQLFGGSNSKGVVEGTATVDVTPNGNCTILTQEVYGGGNMAPGGNAIVTIPCGATGLTDVYGGAKAADIGAPDDRKNVVLTIEGGDMQRVFGGNKAGGVIYGDVKVNLNGSNPDHIIDEVFGGSNAGGNIIGNILVRVNDSVPGCPLQVNTVYGGGNVVAYEPDGTSTVSASRFSPKVELINGTVNQDVFGGGLGEEAVIWSNPQVLVGSNGTNASTSESHTFSVLGNIYGGGSASPVKGSTMIKLTSSPDHDVTIGTNGDAAGALGGYPSANGNLFGGGLGATAIVDGNTSVGVFGNRTTVYHNVYGGGSAGIVRGTTDVQVGADAAFTMALPNIAVGPDGMVTLASTTPGASFRYNIGDAPTDPTTESGNAYSAAFQATAGQIIKAIAYRDGYTPSAVATSAAVPIPVPTVSSDGTTATVTANTTNGPVDQTIYYTLDGSTPDPATANTYTAGVAVGSGDVMKVVATKSGYTQSAVYYTTVATPVVTIEGGNATITCATPDATIRYVLGAEDSSNPGQYLTPDAPAAWSTTGSTTYSGTPVAIAEGQTIKVIADLPGYAPSAVTTKTRSVTP